MGKLAKAMAEDIGAASLRLRLNRALRTLHEDHPSRKYELHVSDFTENEKVWCYRHLMMKYFYRKEEVRPATWVQYDGIWREQKWLKLLEAEGMLLDYQKELKLGPLSGHPDFIARLTPKGETLHILELTGHNKSINFKMLAMRTARKKRQCRMYMVMLAHEVGRDKVGTGFVILEDKATNEFQLIPIPWDAKEMRPLFERVARARLLIRALGKLPEEKRRKAIAKVEGCGRKRCPGCTPKEE